MIPNKPTNVTWTDEQWEAIYEDNKNIISEKLKKLREEKEALFEQARTEIYVSEHYVFHFQPGSLAEKEIVTISQEQEQCFSKICFINFNMIIL